MASKSKFFSRSRGRRTYSEPYHRTGGLLYIDTSVGDTSKEAYLAADITENARSPGRQRPNLILTIPSDYFHHRHGSSPAAARHNAALVTTASNLLAVVNDMLRSPALSATVCPQSASIHKPLPSRPRSMSMPPNPKPPVELPGSILLENHGFSSPLVVEPIACRSHKAMSLMHSGNSPSSGAVGVKSSPSKVPRPKKSMSEASLQRRSKSKPSLITSPSSTDSKLTACSVSSNGGHTSSNDSTRARVGVGAEQLLQPSPLIVEGKPWRKSGGEGSSRDELGTPSTPTPTTTRSRRIEELKATITAQDNTISTLQAQFSSLRASQDAHVTSLIEAHVAEVASLKNYTRVLEEQQSQHNLHHASSNHLLLFLDPTEPHSPSPTRERSQNTAQAGNTSATSATSTLSFNPALEQPLRSPLRDQSRDSPEMENLKRKLSMARRPEVAAVGNRDLIRELNQYKQNTVALQKQIASLMAKLNQSKQQERSMAARLEEVEKTSLERQAKASKVDQLEKSALALQNTIDHLEYRLDMANCEKIDAEEHVFNLQSGRSPFDAIPSKLDIPEDSSRDTDRQNAHASMSTVFSSNSPVGHGNDAQDSTTLAAFIAHIERLQEQIKQKDSQYLHLKLEIQQLYVDYGQLERDHKGSVLESDIRNQEHLLKQANETDVHIDQLRTAIIDRESIIAEKDKTLRMAERQLEHHKLLLHAEIRRHATMSILADTSGEPLPDLTSLASKEDIDRWLLRLQDRLKKEKSKLSEQDVAQTSRQKPSNDLEVLVDDMRREIDFYVREIIYYKLDIKGYKSDIKKLKQIASRLVSYGSRASDIESPTPSQSRSVDTPIRSLFSHGTPGLGISSTPSPVTTGPISASVSLGRPFTPAGLLPTPDFSPTDVVKPSPESQGRILHQPAPWTPQLTPMTPQAPPFRPQTPSFSRSVNVANEADSMNPGISPRSVAKLSPERRKPTPPSPDQERFGDLATNFPLNTPASPKRHDTQRSMSDSIIQLYTAPRTPDWSPSKNIDRTPEGYNKQVADTRQRSASVPDPSKEISTPERPPRPQYGLYESPAGQGRTGGLSSPPRMDVLAEAMRNSPDRENVTPKPLFKRKLSDSSASALRGLSNSQLSHPGSPGSISAIPAPLSLHPRAGSAGSTTATGQNESPQRKPSSSGSSNMPFIIGMPSPHNHALITPVTSYAPTACSITAKCAAAAAPKSSTSRAGVGGTMASSASRGSSAEHTDGGLSSYFESAFGSSRAGSATHSRNISLGSMSMTTPSKRDTASSGKSGGHSRNGSGSSIRNAMQLPSSLMKGKGKTRKESISHPTPLASPFDIDRGNTASSASMGRAA